MYNMDNFAIFHKCFKSGQFLLHFHFFIENMPISGSYPQSYQQKQMFMWKTHKVSVTLDKCYIYRIFNLKIPSF